MAKPFQAPTLKLVYCPVPAFPPSRIRHATDEPATSYAQPDRPAYGIQRCWLVTDLKLAQVVKRMLRLGQDDVKSARRNNENVTRANRGHGKAAESLAYEAGPSNPGAHQIGNSGSVVCSLRTLWKFTEQRMFQVGT